MQLCIQTYVDKEETFKISNGMKLIRKSNKKEEDFNAYYAYVCIADWFVGNYG